MLFSHSRLVPHVATFWQPELDKQASHETAASGSAYDPGIWHSRPHGAEQFAAMHWSSAGVAVALVGWTMAHCDRQA